MAASPGGYYADKDADMILSMIEDGNLPEIDLDEDDEEYAEDIPGPLSGIRVGASTMTEADEIVVNNHGFIGFPAEDQTLQVQVDNQTVSDDNSDESQLDDFSNYNFITNRKDIQYRRRPYNETAINFENNNALKDFYDDGHYPIEYFMKYITNDVFNKFQEFTNLYAVQKNVSRFRPTSIAEIKTLIGFHIAVGVFKFPRVRMYWDSFSGLDLCLLKKNCFLKKTKNFP
ncbi:uncharacterized protein LOC120352224 [Nilaparvata lugens]|uniref:uncharacterized protein LOC120352224 n=1 Tax=Nilaparvata lugens TaxID=108931 RepID=UPI00193D4635|nr:uncharacterized protein LOC120352224 [Nilaparvata lugens]